MVRCPVCGLVAGAGAEECADCGHLFVVKPRPAAVPAQTKKIRRPAMQGVRGIVQRKWVPVAALVALVIAVGATTRPKVTVELTSTGSSITSGRVVNRTGRPLTISEGYVLQKRAAFDRGFEAGDRTVRSQLAWIQNHIWMRRTLPGVSRKEAEFRSFLEGNGNPEYDEITVPAGESRSFYAYGAPYYGRGDSVVLYDQDGHRIRTRTVIRP
ncbi:MAG: hypothetical protein IH945_02070 [Armatimonadetes bacterium]|nr:hypothetical protein [Armatimonadota bacterium]